MPKYLWVPKIRRKYPCTVPFIAQPPQWLQSSPRCQMKDDMHTYLFLKNIPSDKMTHCSARWGQSSDLGFVMLFECQKHHFPLLEIYQIFRNNLSWSQMKESERKLMGTDILGWISLVSTVRCRHRWRSRPPPWPRTAGQGGTWTDRQDWQQL